MELVGSQSGRVHGTVHYGASPALHQYHGASRALNGNAVFADELKRMHTVFAQGVSIQADVRPGGMLRSLDRVRPFIASLPITEDQDLRWSGGLGDWPSSDMQAFMLELVVPPLPVGVGLSHPAVARRRRRSQRVHARRSADRRYDVPIAQFPTNLTTVMSLL